MKTTINRNIIISKIHQELDILGNLQSDYVDAFGSSQKFHAYSRDEDNRGPWSHFFVFRSDGNIDIQNEKTNENMDWEEQGTRGLLEILKNIKNNISDMKVRLKKHNIFLQTEVESIIKEQGVATRPFLVLRRRFPNFQVVFIYSVGILILILAYVAHFDRLKNVL